MEKIMEKNIIRKKLFKSIGKKLWTINIIRKNRFKSIGIIRKNMKILLESFKNYNHFTNLSIEQFIYINTYKNNYKYIIYNNIIRNNHLYDGIFYIFQKLTKIIYIA